MKMYISEISSEERRADLARAEHAQERYQHYLDVTNRGRGSYEIDRHLDKHQGTMFELAKKYGTVSHGPELLAAIKIEPAPLIYE